MGSVTCAATGSDAASAMYDYDRGGTKKAPHHGSQLLVVQANPGVVGA